MVMTMWRRDAEAKTAGAVKATAAAAADVAKARQFPGAILNVIEAAQSWRKKL